MVDRSNDHDEVPTMIRRGMVKAVADRDWSAQEVLHYLMDLPLYQSTFSFIPINLNGDRELRVGEQAERVSRSSYLDAYATRPRDAVLDAMNFETFCRQYVLDTSTGAVSQRSTTCVVRFFPWFSSDPNGAKYALYARFALLRYCPWRGDFTAMVEDPSVDQQWIDAWADFLRSSNPASLLVPSSSLRLRDALARHSALASDLAGVSVVDDAPEVASASWMQIARGGPEDSHVLPDLASASDFASHSLSDDVVAALPTWMRDQRAQWQQSPQQPQQQQQQSQQRPPIDPTTLNTQQRRAFDIIAEHSGRQSPSDPLRMIVCGSAGTGKSLSHTRAC